MPGAGFYPIHNSEIRFGKDGQWYGDGELIQNHRIARLFARSIERSEEGGYRLRVGDETAAISVEDTPYVVTEVSVENDLRVTLNDGSNELVEPRSLELGEDHVFYCPVKNGRERARFLRPAHYQLGHYIDEDPAGDFVLRLGADAIPICRT